MQLRGARSHTVLAFADELIENPELFESYAAEYGPDDDATLVVYAPDGDPVELEPRLLDALASVGLENGRCPDLLALVTPREAAAELGLAQAVQAIHTGRTQPAPFDRLPRFAAAA